MSRFLLRPSVHCHNLGSKVLSMSLAARADDFEHRYGYRPWLVESLVDTDQYAGTRYQAANRTRVGQTQDGLGGRQHRRRLSTIVGCALGHEIRALICLLTREGRNFGVGQSKSRI
ncbi:MAG: DUF4338 domain-containing protein [Proteobacteria bacterium]|nr:DUF4338 domain-containing protein [Pseudomonadota bacterium]